MSQPVPKKSPSLKFLLDENVDVRLSSYLKKLGFSVKLAAKGMKNSELINQAKDENCILMTNDKDFANSDLYNPSEFTGIIVFQIHPPLLANIVNALDKFLEKNKNLNFKGKLFILK